MTDTWPKTSGGDLVERIATAMWDDTHWNTNLPSFAHEHLWGDDWPEEFGWMRDLILDQAVAAAKVMGAI